MRRHCVALVFLSCHVACAGRDAAMPPPAGAGALGAARQPATTDAALRSGANRAVVAMALRGSLLEALEKAHGALAKCANDSDLLNTIGCILLFALCEGSWCRAEDYFCRSLQCDPLNAATMYNYAKLLSMRPHTHRHNKKCPARQLLRAACQLNLALPAVIINARALLLEERTSASGDESSVAGSHDSEPNTDASRDASSEEYVHEGGRDLSDGRVRKRAGSGVRKRAVRFGVNSRAHARSMGKIARRQGLALAEGGGGGAGAAAAAAAAAESRERQDITVLTFKGAKNMAESSEMQDSSCLVPLQSPHSACTSLVFCTSLSGSKCFTASQRSCMVSWMNGRTNQTHEPHASPSTITTSRPQDGTCGDEAAIRKEILSLFAPPTDEDSESARFGPGFTPASRGNSTGAEVSGQEEDEEGVQEGVAGMREREKERAILSREHVRRMSRILDLSLPETQRLAFVAAHVRQKRPICQKRPSVGAKKTYYPCVGAQVRESERDRARPQKGILGNENVQHENAENANADGACGMSSQGLDVVYCVYTPQPGKHGGVFGGGSLVHREASLRKRERDMPQCRQAHGGTVRARGVVLGTSGTGSQKYSLSRLCIVQCTIAVYYTNFTAHSVATCSVPVPEH
jgi:hypothetical protein